MLRQRRAGVGVTLAVALTTAAAAGTSAFAHTSASGAQRAVRAAAAPADRAAAPVRGGTLTLGLPEVITGFGPFDTRTRDDYEAIMNVFDTLVRYGKNYIPTADLAIGWSHKGTRTWVFKLRRGVRFTDGTPFDAKAAVFSLNLLRKSPFGSQVSRIRSVKATGPYTLQITTSKAFPTLPAVLTQPFASMVSPTAYRRLGAKAFAKKPVGSGPFEVQSWDPRGSAVLVRNPGYWRKDAKGHRYPYLDRVVIKPLPDLSSEVAALQAGQIDMLLNPPPAQVRVLQAAGKKISNTPSLGWEYLTIQTSQPPFDDVHRRLAVQYAIDRQAIVDTVKAGQATAALGPLPPGSWAYDPGIKKHGLYGPHADLAKARAELAKANPPGGFSFTLIYPTQDPFTGIAQAVKAQLAKVGITANLDGEEIGAALDKLFASKFQALAIDWSGRIDEDLSTAAFYETGGANNYGKFSDPKVDALLREAGTISSRARRATLYREAQALINRRAPLMLIDFPYQTVAMGKNVNGFVNLGDQRIFLYDVWLAH